MVGREGVERGHGGRVVVREGVERGCGGRVVVREGVERGCGGRRKRRRDYGLWLTVTSSPSHETAKTSI